MSTWTLLLVFACVAGLAWLAGSGWLRAWSPQARARALQLQQIRRQLQGQAGEGLRDHRRTHGGIDRWLHAHIPAVHRLDHLLVRARSPRSPLQVLAACVLAGVVAGLGALLVGLAWLTLAVAGLAAVLPVLHLVRVAAWRRRRFEQKLPEALDFLARALRAGHSLTVALGMAGQELAAPLGEEFKTVFDEVGFGIQFGEAMTDMARRIESRDLDVLVIALLVQRETGGNLTELLEGLARTVRDRQKLHGKVRALSSEGRFSAGLLGSLPFILGVILSVINPGYMAPLWQTAEGRSLLAGGAVQLVLGFVVLLRIIRIRV